LAPRPIFSDHFFVIQGLNGVSGPHTVPAGEVHVVKQLTAYASPLIGNVHVFFHHADYNAALWSVSFTLGQSGNFNFYGALVFRAGETMNFQVNTSDPTDGADVYAGGYILLGPGAS